jgi:hypothetical protein
MTMSEAEIRDVVFEFAEAHSMSPSLLVRLTNRILDCAAEAVAGNGHGSNDHLYTSSPEMGYLRQRKLSDEILNLKVKS